MDGRVRSGVYGANRQASQDAVSTNDVSRVVEYESSRLDYVSGAVAAGRESVYGVYSTTRYAFAVNGVAGNSAQASAAAAFFAR